MKPILLTLLLLTTLLSCNNQNQQNMTHSQNQTLITQYFTHFNNHDWTQLAAMYADKVKCKDPTLGPGIVQQTGKELADKYEKLQHIFADLKDAVLQMYPSGDKHIIVEFVSSGTAPDGSKFELPICTIFTIEDGKITKDFTYFDNFEEEEEGKN